MPPTNNQFCSNVQADGTLSCGGGDYCPSGYSCITAVLTSNQDGHLYQACQCWPNSRVFPKGWRPKYEVAGLVGDTQDLPRREVTALTTPITPVFLREFLGRLSPPPEIRVGSVSTGLGNRDIFHPLFQQYWVWWLWTPLDFPQPWWTNEELAIWNDYYNGCGQTPPGFSGEAQRICAAQKYNHLRWVRRGMAERNMEQALKFS